MIALARAVAARDRLTRLGYRVEWHEYPMPHSVCPEELAELSTWLRRVLG
jgi:phospholipase/carboxylesterase